MHVLFLGFSTFLGMVVLAFAASEVFRIFFRMFFGIVVLGLLHDLCILPVYLSMLCWKPAVIRRSSGRISVEELERGSPIGEGSQPNIWNAYDSLQVTDGENASWAAENAAFVPSDAADIFKMKTNPQKNRGQISNKEDHTEDGILQMEDSAIKRGIENHGLETEEELDNIAPKANEELPNMTENTSANKSEEFAHGADDTTPNKTELSHITDNTAANENEELAYKADSSAASAKQEKQDWDHADSAEKEQSDT